MRKRFSVLIAFCCGIFSATISVAQVCTDATLPDASSLQVFPERDSVIYLDTLVGRDSTIIHHEDRNDGGIHVLAPGNDNFVNATLLTVGAGNTAGTTIAGSLEASEALDCAGPTDANDGITQTVWYKFVATATTQYVTIAPTSAAIGFCTYLDGRLQTLATAVWPASASVPTSICPPSLSCRSGVHVNIAVGTSIHQLTGLTVGSTYYVQVMDNSGCNGGVNFNIRVDNANATGGHVTNPTSLTTCATANAGCYFTTPPTVATVTGTCPGYGVAGLLEGDVWWNYMSFTNTANSTTVNFQMINNFPGGLVTFLDWQLYNSSCGIITCGTLSNVTLLGMGCNTSYVLHYRFQVYRAGTTVWPYQYAPLAPPPCTVLPIELLYFKGNYNQPDNSVKLEWSTASESNNSYFLVDKTTDGVNYTPVGRVASLAPGGNSTSQLTYSLTDPATEVGKVYYRLTQVDISGNKENDGMTDVDVPAEASGDLSIVPNPGDDAVMISFDAANDGASELTVIDNTGRVVFSKNVDVVAGNNSLAYNTSELSPGFYFVQVRNAGHIYNGKLLRK